MSILSTIPRRSGLAGPGCPLQFQLLQTPAQNNVLQSPDPESQTARAIRGDTLECGAERFQPARDQAIRRGYKALSGPYGVGSVYYPGLLEEIVCGDSPDELARSAAPLFKRMDVPSLDVWMPLFWDISVQAGFATPLDTWGIPHDVWRLRLPEPGIFLPLLEQHLPELSSLAEMTHAAQAA